MLTDIKSTGALKRPFQGLIALALMVTAFFAYQSHVIGIKSTTMDESAHYIYGKRCILGHTRRFLEAVMPVSALNLVPWRIGRLLPEGRLRTFLCDFYTARYVTLLFAVLLGILIFRWAGQLYGPRAGLLSAFLYFIDPNILGHSTWITVDLYAALGTAFALYRLWRYLRSPDLRRALLFGVALGFAQTAKYSCAILLPVSAAAILIDRIRPLAPAAGGERRRNRTSLTQLVVIGAACALMINGAYLFNKTGTPLRDYAFMSDEFRQMRDRGGVLSALPVPLPKPYVQGFDISRDNDKKHNLRGRSYLFGKTRTAGETPQGRFENYYFFVLLFKTPIALMALFGLAVGDSLRQRKELREEAVILGLGIVAFFCFFNYFVVAQLGVRHLLMIFPLMHVWCGRLAQPSADEKRGQWVAVAVLTAYLAVSSLSYFDHHLSYFNELVGRRVTAYKLLSDSNIDWKQNERLIQRYKENHPEIQINPGVPVRGKVAISVLLLTGVLGSKDSWFEWIRTNLEPAGHVGYSYIIFNIDQSSFEKIPEKYFNPSPAVDKKSQKKRFGAISRLI